MRLRIAKLNDVHLLTCIKYGLWGGNTTRFRNWQEGDLVAFTVDKAIAGMAEVSGEYDVSKEQIWDDEIFPYRIPINFLYAFVPKNRPTLAGEIKAAMIASWGPNYGLGILTQRLLQVESAQKIVQIVQSYQNNLAETRKNIDQLLNQARDLRKLKKR